MNKANYSYLWNSIIYFCQWQLYVSQSLWLHRMTTTFKLIKFSIELRSGLHASQTNLESPTSSRYSLITCATLSSIIINGYQWKEQIVQQLLGGFFHRSSGQLELHFEQLKNCYVLLNKYPFVYDWTAIRRFSLMRCSMHIFY